MQPLVSSYSTSNIDDTYLKHAYSYDTNQYPEDYPLFLTRILLIKKVGFSAATADSRIRKYESNAMAPKADIRTKLADALLISVPKHILKCR